MSAKNEPPFRLDLPFGAALERFIATNPDEVRAEMKRWKRDRDKAIADAPNVSDLKRTREKKRNGQ